MRAVKGRDTGAEIAVRKVLYGLGYRYRLNRSDLPGKPDIVFPGRRKVIFVHGCFWHGHDCRRGARTPINNREYWLNKISRNRERDQRTKGDLGDLGWGCLVVWECEIKDDGALKERLVTFLQQPI